MDYTYKFPAVAGKQAKEEYYISMVPLDVLGKLFLEEEIISPEFRAQRRLNSSRIPQIKKYILNNSESYVFSALAASIDGEFVFKESNEFVGVGILEVDMRARFLINDGQHRKAAIIEALKENPELGSETISVVFYKDMGLQRSQQMFTDLNKHAVKTSNSIAELFDSRDKVAVATRNVISKIDFLNEYTDKERDNLGKYSSSLFTLNTFYLSNKRILGNHKDVSEKDEKFLYDFWSNVVENILLWSDLEKREIRKKDLREKYVVNQGVVIQALAVVGHDIYIKSTKDLDILKRLRNINWLRTAEMWQGRIINENGKVISGEKAILSASLAIKYEIGMEKE